MRQFLTRHRADGLTLICLTALLAFFYRQFLAGTAYMWDDLLFNIYPYANYFSTSVRAGHFPLWMAGVETGTPFYSDPIASVFYPMTWLLPLFAGSGRLPFLVYQWYIVVHMLLAGLGMYWFLRDQSLRRLACLGGAIAFCFSGAMSMSVIHFPKIQVYLWWPLQLLFVRRLHLTGERKYYGWLIGTLAVSFFGGWPAYSVYGAYLLIAYWLFCAWERQVHGCHLSPAKIGICLSRQLFKALGVLVVVLMLGACLALPAYESYSQAPRYRWGFQEKAEQSLPYYYLLHLAAPKFFGASSGEPTAVPFWGAEQSSRDPEQYQVKPWLYWEYQSYAGQMAILAVLVLLWNRNTIRSRAPVLFFLGVATFALWFMLGRYGGLFNLLYYTLPGVSLFREPTRVACVLNFATAVLVAFFIHELRETPTLKLRAPIITVGLIYGALVLAYLYCGDLWFRELQLPAYYANGLHQIGWAVGTMAALIAACALVTKRPGHSLQAVALGVVLLVNFADLYRVHGDFHRGQTNPDQFFSDRCPLIPYLQTGRHAAQPDRIIQVNAERDRPVEICLAKDYPYFDPRVELLDGYVLWYNAAIESFRAITNWPAKLDIQNAGLVITRDAQTGQTILMENPSTLPRAKFYSDIRRYDRLDDLWQDLSAGQLDYRTTLAVHGVEHATQMTQPATNATVRFERDSSEQYRLAYQVDTPGIIFISEAWYPGWRATDQRGRTYRVIKTFGAFKGIVIPEPGRGVLTVSFRPWTLRVGLLISVVTLAGTWVVCRHGNVLAGLRRLWLQYRA